MPGNIPVIGGTKHTLIWIIYLPILATDDVVVEPIPSIVAFFDNFSSVFNIFNPFSVIKSAHCTDNFTPVG